MYTAHWYLAVEAGGALPDTCPKAPTLTLDNAVAQDAGRLWRKAAGRMLALHGMPLPRMPIIALLPPPPAWQGPHRVLRVPRRARTTPPVSDPAHAIAPRWSPPRGGAVSSVDDPNIRTWSVCVWHSKDVYLRTCVRNLAIF